MPVEQPSGAENRSAFRPRRSDTTWMLVMIAIVAGGLLGYIFRPAIDNFGQTTGDENSAGLTTVAQSQVNDRIVTALTPLNTSLDELKKMVSSENGDSSMPDSEDLSRIGSTSSAARISSEIDMIRLMLNDRVSHVEQLIKQGDEEARAQLDAFVEQTSDQLNQIGNLEDSVNMLASEFPKLQDRVRTLRPEYENSESNPSDETTVGRSVLETDFRPTQSLGTLVINNVSARVATLLINGQNQVIQPGKNSIRVPLDKVLLRHPESNMAWTLDSSLWELFGDQYVMTRNWSY